jgi:hypothetical protein
MLRRFVKGIQYLLFGQASGRLSCFIMRRNERNSADIRCAQANKPATLGPRFHSRAATSQQPISRNAFDRATVLHLTVLLLLLSYLHSPPVLDSTQHQLDQPNHIRYGTFISMEKVILRVEGRGTAADDLLTCVVSSSSIHRQSLSASSRLLSLPE